MEVTTYKCDVCGVQKGETNHWFKAFCLTGPEFYIIGWDARGEDADSRVWKHLCGRDCVTRWLHQQFAEER